MEGKIVLEIQSYLSAEDKALLQETQSLLREVRDLLKASEFYIGTLSEVSDRHLTQLNDYDEPDDSDIRH